MADMEFDESRFIEIENRLNLYHSLKAKYGDSVADIIQYQKELEEKIEQYKEYDLYLEEHKANVAKGYRWIRENLPEIIELYYGNEFNLEQQICYQHDASKTEMDEYVAYDRYFYGGPQGKSYGAVKEFNYAWLRHIHRNPHHRRYRYILHPLLTWYERNW